VATLANYLTETRRLLHDANGRYWTDPDLISAINQAQRRTVADSACLRRLQQIYISTGIELYSYGSVSGALVTLGGSGYVAAPAVTIAAPPAGGTQAVANATVTAGAVAAITITTTGSGYLTAPAFTIAPPPAGVTATATGSILAAETLDVLNITVLWGTMRITLDRMPFTAFQASVRAWQGFSQRPVWSCSYGQSSWYIGPIPDQNYVSEWDTVMTPTDLVNTTDVSPVIYPYTDVLPFYAAHIAKFKEQSHNESDTFLVLYQRKLQHAIRSAMRRTLPSAYGS
jgi:hypothetical protein